MAHDSSNPSSFFQLTPNIRIRSLDELVEVVPYLVGFHPTDSVLVLGRRRDSAAVGRVLCCPLRSANDPSGEAPARLAGLLAAEGMGRAYIIIFGSHRDQPEPEAFRPLVERLRLACDAKGVDAEDVLYLHSERVWSLSCDDAECCPPDGRPVVSAGMSQIAAAAAYAGVPVIRPRAELVAALEPSDSDPGDPLVHSGAFDAARRAYLQAREEGRIEEWRCARIRDWEVARTVEDGRITDPEAAGRLVHSLFEMVIRDHVCSWAGDERRDAGLRLVCELVRRTPSGLDLPALTVVAWLAWACDDRALACVAVDLALERDERYRFARIIADGLRSGLGGEYVVRLSAELADGGSRVDLAALAQAEAAAEIRRDPEAHPRIGGADTADRPPARSRRVPRQRGPEDAPDCRDGSDAGGNRRGGTGERP